MTGYFSAGGLLSSVGVSVVQLVVKFTGFAIAIPILMNAAGGMDAIAQSPALPATFLDPLFSAGAGSGFTLLLLSGPNFVVSPGLIQKAYGAESPRAVRMGVGANAIALMTFAFLPVLLGLTRSGALPRHRNSRRGAADAVVARLAGVAGGARARRSVFSGGRRVRSDPLHAVDVAVTGSLQARRQSVRDSGAGAVRRARRGVHRRHGGHAAGDLRRWRDHRRTDGVLFDHRGGAVRAGRGRTVRAATPPSAMRLPRSLRACRPFSSFSTARSTPAGSMRTCGDSSPPRRGSSPRSWCLRCLGCLRCQGAEVSSLRSARLQAANQPVRHASMARSVKPSPESRNSSDVISPLHPGHRSGDFKTSTSDRLCDSDEVRDINSIAGGSPEALRDISRTRTHCVAQLF